MTVTRISDHSDHETVALLETLLERARGGRLPAIACVFKTGPKRHRLAIAGDYWRDPLEVLGGVTRLEYKINQIINERDSGAPETRTMPL